MRCLPVLLTIAAVVIFNSPINSRTHEPLSIRGFDSQQTTMFVWGIAKGIQYFDTALLLSGKPRLYCKPLDGYAVSGNEIWALASKALRGPHRPDLIAVAALDELTKKYPCTK